MTTALEPLQVSDVRDDDYWNTAGRDPEYCDQVREWLRANGVEPNATYRWEVYLLDAPFAKVFTYELRDDGKVRVRGGEPVKVAPFTVLLSSLPPALKLSGE